MRIALTSENSNRTYLVRVSELVCLVKHIVGMRPTNRGRQQLLSNQNDLYPRVGAHQEPESGLAALGGERRAENASLLSECKGDCPLVSLPRGEMRAQATALTRGVELISTICFRSAHLRCGALWR